MAFQSLFVKYYCHSCYLTTKARPSFNQKNIQETSIVIICTIPLFFIVAGISFFFHVGLFPTFDVL